MPKKITLTLEDNALQALTELQETGGYTQAAVFRDALGFYHWSLRMAREGKTMAYIDENGDVHKIVLPFTYHVR